MTDKVVLVTCAISVSGHQAKQIAPIYSASKHVIQSFVPGVRRQFAPHNVCIGAIEPSVVPKPLWGFAEKSGIDTTVAVYEGIHLHDVVKEVMFMSTGPPHINVQDHVSLSQNQDI